MKQMLIYVLGLMMGGGPIMGGGSVTGGGPMIGNGPMKIGASGAAVRAQRDFIKREGDGREEKWYKTGEGFLAEFEYAGHEGQDFYDQKGNWRYSVLTFGEKGLPEGIRRMVRSTYFDFAISWVKEVNGLEGGVYLVHIENEKAWKELVVREEEMTVWKAFDK